MLGRLLTEKIWDLAKICMMQGHKAEASGDLPTSGVYLSDGLGCGVPFLPNLYYINTKD